MGYTLTIDSVLKVKDQLETLLHSKLEVVYFDTSNPERLSWLIMQGISAAVKNDIPRYKDLKDKFKFTREKDRLKCIRSVPLVSSAYLEFPEVSDLLELLDKYITYQSENIELRFPIIVVDEPIAEWLTKQNIKFLSDGKSLIIYPKENSNTIKEN